MDSSVLAGKSQRLAEFGYLLSRATSVEEGFALLDAQVRAYHFDGVAYSAMPVSIGAQGSFQPVFLTSNDYSRDFLNHYDEAGLWQQDFTIDRIQRGSLVVMDWQLELKKDVLTTHQTEVVDLATFEYGIKNAVTVPTQADEHIIAGSSVIGYVNRTHFEEICSKSLKEVVQLIQMFHQYVFIRTDTAAYFYQPLIDSLTETQKRVLAFIVKGHFQKHSEEYIGISPTRTGNVLSELYECLNVSNVSQLSYLAGRHRLIDML